MLIIKEIMQEVINQIANHYHTTAKNVLLAYNNGNEKIIKEVQKLYIQSYKELEAIAKA
jgi:hypothetical protein